MYVCRTSFIISYELSYEFPLLYLSTYFTQLKMIILLGLHTKIKGDPINNLYKEHLRRLVLNLKLFVAYLLVHT